MLHNIFMEICPPVPEKKIFERFLPYSTVSETFISFTLTNVEFRKSRDFFAWILR